MRVSEGLLVVVLCLGLSQAYEDKTVAQWLSDNGYTKLVDNLTKTGLYQVLNGNGAFTIFAPTDTAFGKAGDLPTSPSELQKLLKYHVIPKYILKAMVSTSMTEKTLEGQSLNITSAAGYMVNGVAHISPGSDIIVNNGVIQPIDTVLTPPVQHLQTIAQILIMDDSRFANMYMALTIFDLAQLLSIPGSQFTVFAAIDDAFMTFNDSQLNFVQENATYVHRELFKYSIVPGTRFAADLTPHVPLYTLHGQPLTITGTSPNLMVDNAHIIQADIPASNGVVHVVDGILTPKDILRP